MALGQTKRARRTGLQHIAAGLYREALDLANQANFTQRQLEAHRKAMDHPVQDRQRSVRC